MLSMQGRAELAGTDEHPTEEVSALQSPHEPHSPQEWETGRFLEFAWWFSQWTRQLFCLCGMGVFISPRLASGRLCRADAEEAGGGFEFADVPVHAVDGKARGFGEFTDGHIRHGADDGQDFLGVFRGAGGRGEGDGVVFLVVFPAVPTAASPLAVRARKMDEATRRRDDEGVEGEERRTTTVCARALSSVRRLVDSSRGRERAAAAKKTRPRVEARSVLGLRAGPAQPRPIMLKTRTKRATVSTTPRVIR